MLPNTIPTHYGISGSADGWGSKYETIILPIITIAFVAFMVIIGKFAKKQENNAAQNEKILAVANYIIAFVFNGLAYWFLYSAFTNTSNLYESNIDGMKLIAIIMSIACIFLGNILPKCKQNAITGIRTKWTLENENVWYKTHRMGGNTIAIFGIVSTIFCLIIPNGLIAFFTVFGGIILITIPIIIYSYVIYKKTVK